MIALFHVVTDKTLTFAILHQIITTSESAQNKTSHFSDQGSCQSDTQNIFAQWKMVLPPPTVKLSQSMSSVQLACLSFSFKINETLSKVHFKGTRI